MEWFREQIAFLLFGFSTGTVRIKQMVRNYQEMPCSGFAGGRIFLTFLFCAWKFWLKNTIFNLFNLTFYPEREGDWFPHKSTIVRLTNSSVTSREREDLEATTPGETFECNCCKRRFKKRGLSQHQISCTEIPPQDEMSEHIRTGIGEIEWASK